MEGLGESMVMNSMLWKEKGGGGVKKRVSGEG